MAEIDRSGGVPSQYDRLAMRGGAGGAVPGLAARNEFGSANQALVGDEPFERPQPSASSISSRVTRPFSTTSFSSP